MLAARSGIGQAARAAGDGYTLLLSLSSISILPEADRILERKPSVPTRSDSSRSPRITADPTVLGGAADAPWRTLEDFIADVRRNPGKYNYGSSGNYGTMHVPMEMLKSAADFRMTHIPYAGAGPAVIALLGGHVDAVSSGPASVVQQIRAGRLRALAHWGDAPLTTLPGVPSLKERGYQCAIRAVVGLVCARVDSGSDRRTIACDSAQADVGSSARSRRS